MNSLTSEGRVARVKLRGNELDLVLCESEPTSDMREGFAGTSRRSSTSRMFGRGSSVRQTIQLLLVEAAARGACVAIVPRLVARDALVAGRVRILAQLDSGHGGIHALCQDDEAAALSRRAIELLIARHMSERCAHPAR